jgi:drug/metabolite transporter (DMT)-like permease
MKMNLRKNIGIIMMMLGVLLTINQGQSQNEFLKQIEMTLKTYWPLIISFIGIYMISTPKRRR